ncbi:DUF397 domain-containing protein [Spirillospora sp. NPDC029432]|uniref:DUF397 domain-containing protein n=1 Tax=Spirillospora sp. NPDC029432 TaxID=3154599 RepID=UPI00345308F9
MSHISTSIPSWRRSRHCGASNTCVEVALFDGSDLPIAARDAKNGPEGPTLRFSRSAWGAFVQQAREGAFDLPG